MYFIVGIIVLYATYRICYKLTSGTCRCPTKLTNKVAIVTGSNTGIGFETAQNLALRGAKVILACRDLNKGKAAKDKIVRATGNQNVVYKQLDLTSFASVCAFTKDVLQTEAAIHILVNNAGIGKLDNSLTEDNLPIETQTNHFSPFLLTNQLLPIIKSSAPSRIINVSSCMHRLGKIDLDNIHKPAKTWLQHSRVYSNTKLANLLFTNKLSRELQGSGVTVNCLHPGAVSTDMFRNKYFIIKLLIHLVCKTPLEGAQTTIHLAVAPKLRNVTGKYFVDCEETRASSRAQNHELADKLWTLSDKITALGAETNENE